MVFEKTITIVCFLAVWPLPSVIFNGFSFCYHRFQWFLMVPDHWSNDAMVSMDRCGLVSFQRGNKRHLYWIQFKAYRYCIYIYISRYLSNIICISLEPIEQILLRGGLRNVRRQWQRLHSRLNQGPFHRKSP